ncbi:DNA topoisomerase IV subunit A, partial [Francisella tularensis subsp. holarctica]|nr:DNA topoisomerase IV subunit A [Francisella tularensis subsp. holarctica]
SYKTEDKQFLLTTGISNIKLVFFSKLCKAYYMYIDKLPSARGYGEHITTYITLDKQDHIKSISFVNAAGYFLIASESGKA